MSEADATAVPAMSQLMDKSALSSVCESMAALYQVGVKVFDVEGTRLADARGPNGPHCELLFSVHPTQRKCTQLVGHLKSFDLDTTPEPRVLNCFSGLRYQVVPLVYQKQLLGRLIVGPYAPSELQAPPAELAEYGQAGLNLERLHELQKPLPRREDASIERLIEHAVAVFEVLVHNGYKTYVTNKMHLESISTAFSDLENTNRELRAANARLRELDQLKSNFVATVSHELRTPLTSVIGYSEMLLEGMAGAINDEQRSYISTILEKGESLLHLIGQVLDLSRTEASGGQLQQSDVDVPDLLALCVSDVRPQADAKELQIEKAISESVQPIAGDAQKLRRVVTNLLANAVKFTPQGGRIALRADVVDDTPPGDERMDIFEPERNRFLRLEVEDTGIGIPEDKLERIFDSFFQVDSSSTRQFSGTGLGLSIVRNWVRMHEGRIDVRSQPGAGTTFTVKLPYVRNRELVETPVDGLLAANSEKTSA